MKIFSIYILLSLSERKSLNSSVMRIIYVLCKKNTWNLKAKQVTVEIIICCFYFFCQLTYVCKYVLYTHITQWLKKYINTYCHTLLGYQTADYDTYRLSMFCCKYVRYKVTKIFAFNENVIKKMKTLWVEQMWN